MPRWTRRQIGQLGARGAATFCIAFAMFQLSLAAGAPWGDMTWGAPPLSSRPKCASPALPPLSTSRWPAQRCWLGQAIGAEICHRRRFAGSTSSWPFNSPSTQQPTWPPTTRLSATGWALPPRWGSSCASARFLRPWIGRFDGTTLRADENWKMTASGLSEGPQWVVCSHWLPFGKLPFGKLPFVDAQRVSACRIAT